MRVRSGMIVGLFALVAAALTPMAAQAAEEYNLWYVNPVPNTPDWGRSARLFEEAVEEMGYRATVTGPNGIDVPAMIAIRRSPMMPTGSSRVRSIRPRSRQ